MHQNFSPFLRLLEYYKTYRLCRILFRYKASACKALFNLHLHLERFVTLLNHACARLPTTKPDDYGIKFKTVPLVIQFVVNSKCCWDPEHSARQDGSLCSFATNLNFNLINNAFTWHRKTANSALQESFSCLQLFSALLIKIHNPCIIKIGIADFLYLRELSGCAMLKRIPLNGIAALIPNIVTCDIHLHILKTHSPIPTLSLMVQI